MSGIEVVAAVAGIVSAFAGATSLLRDWKGKRDKKKQARLVQGAELLERSLVVSGPRVQTEYDTGFSRLGATFARGDGETLADVHVDDSRVDHKADKQLQI